MVVVGGTAPQAAGSVQTVGCRRRIPGTVAHATLPLLLPIQLPAHPPELVRRRLRLVSERSLKLGMVAADSSPPPPPASVTLPPSLPAVSSLASPSPSSAER